LDVFPLLLPGGDLTTTELVGERLSLSVDGLLSESMDHPISSYLEAYFTLGDQGDRVAEGIGPILYCWYVPLNIGVHTAKISFTKTSGRVLEYEWSFAIDAP
jgi:hypothetical protein